MKTTVRCKAFSGEGVRLHKVLIDGARVYVWDSVAGQYTSCHSIRKAVQRRLICLALTAKEIAAKHEATKG